MRRMSLAGCLFLFAAAALAQQAAPPMPALFYVHEEIAKPSMIADYEKTTKEFGAMVRGASVPFFYDAYSTSDFHYYFITRMNNAGYLDTMMKLFMMDLPQKAGASKFQDVMRRAGATMESTREWIVLERSDISYMPEKPRLKPEEMQYFQYDFYYVKPGMEDMVDQISNDWKAALAAAKIGDGFTVYQAVVGGDLPLVVVVTPGKSPADIAAQFAANMQTLGDKARMLNDKTFGAIRKFETKVGRARPDLSNPAPQMATK